MLIGEIAYLSCCTHSSVWISGSISLHEWANVLDEADTRIFLEVRNESLLIFKTCFIAAKDDAKWLRLNLETHIDNVRHCVWWFV